VNVLKNGQTLRIAILFALLNILTTLLPTAAVSEVKSPEITALVLSAPVLRKISITIIVYVVKMLLTGKMYQKQGRILS
jgi:hypothetical protein